MLRYVAKRLLLIVPQTLIVSLGIFLLLRVMPVDPVSKFVGLYSTPDAYLLAQKKLGLDASVISQVGDYFGGMVRGDLGTSWTTRVPIGNEIASRLPVTIQLTVLGFILTLALALPVGLAIASRPGGKLDKFVSGYSLFAGSQPDFWWALLFIFFFYFKAQWFPAPLGITSIGIPLPPPVTNFILIDSLLAGSLSTFWDALWHLALPAFTLAFVLSGPIIKMVRQSAGDVFGSDFIVFARACGLRRRSVDWQALRVSLAPVLTLCGILFGFEIGGALIIESVFSLDGLGLYALQRTLAADFPAIQGAVLVMTAFALLVYVTMDLLHALLDPRVRYQSGH